MKTHYVPITGRAKDKALCNGTVSTDQLTNDLRKTDCLRCIGAMSEFEKIWHEKNNIIYQEHVKKDGRRRGYAVKAFNPDTNVEPKPYRVHLDGDPVRVYKINRTAANKSKIKRLSGWVKSFFVSGGG